MIRSKRTARPGFTIVELMISATITMIIMTILSICFRTSMSAMSSMRAQGDAADQLRAFSATLKRDLTASRSLPTEQSFQVGNRGRRLSDYKFDQGATSPASGYTRIVSAPSIYEGSDGGLLDSYRNATSFMQFTSVLSGTGEGELYNCSSATGMLTSEAAEIEYFTALSGQQTSAGGGTPLPLYNLFRHQRLIAMDSVKQTQFQNSGPNPELVSMSGPNVNSMTTIAIAANRSAPVVPVPYTSRVGEDIILSNVLSFEIKPTWITPPVGGIPPRFFGAANAPIDGQDIYNAVTNRFSSDYPYDSLSAFPGNTFDTAAPLPIRVNAVQIRVRIYDPKVKTARQMTMIIEL